MAVLRVTLFALLVASASGARNPTLLATSPGDRFLDEDFLRDDNNPLEELDIGPLPAPAPAPLSAAQTGSASGAQIAVVKRSMLSPVSAVATMAAPAAKDAATNVSAPAANASAGAESNASANVSSPTHQPTNASANASSNASSVMVTCVTRADPRIGAWFTETAPEGTPCVFGVDVRDEGTHCIFDGGQFGSNGFCFTRVDGSQWGSCNSECPLYGPALQLGKKIDKVVKVVDRIQEKVTSKTASKAAQVQVTTKAFNLLQDSKQARSPQPTQGNTSAIDVGKGGTASKGVVVVPLDSQLQLNSTPTADVARKA